MNNSILLTLVAIASWFTISPDKAIAQAVWPSFLGQGTTEILDANALPLAWSPSTPLRWKASLHGKGQSSPVVFDDLVYVTSIDGEMKETCIVAAFDLGTGVEKWIRTFQSAMPVRSNYFQSRSAPTPIADAKYLIVFFETGNLVGIDRVTGETLWERSLVKDYGAIESTIGLATSPTQLGSRAFLMIDHEGDSYLLAIDKATGETLWRTERFSRKSYASPAIITVGDADQIVCSSSGSVDGYDPVTGKQLWTFEDIGANTSNTPTLVAENTILIGASPGMHDAELADARESNLCLRIDPVDGEFMPHVCWKSEQATTTFASPMAHQGYAYWITNAGVLFCYDLQSGETVYRQRAGEQCWITPVGAGDRIYLFGKGGKTTVIAAGPEFRILSVNELWDIDSIPATDPGQFSGGGSLGRGNPGRGRPSDGSASEGKRPPMSDEDIAGARERGESRFADPVQYGVAMTRDAILIRTGSEVHCIAKEPTP